MNLHDLGLALKEARIQRSLTQSDLSSRTGVSLSTISGLERGNLAEIGTVKLLQLFAMVGLELQPRPAGQRRTLDDINAENALTGHARDAASVAGQKSTGKQKKVSQADELKEFAPARQRVRHALKREEGK